MNPLANGGKLPPVLKTAAMWGHYVLASKQLGRGDSLVLGDDSESLIAAPEDCGIVDVPIRGVGNGWELDPTGVSGGVLFLRGRAEDARAIGERGAPIPIVPGDHGVLQYGSFSLFFQFSETVSPPRRRPRLDAGLLLAWLFAVVTVCGGLLLLSLVYPDLPLPQPVELSTPEQLKKRFRVYSPPAPMDSSSPKESHPEAEVKKKAEDGGRAPRRASRPRRKATEPVAVRVPKKSLSVVTDALDGSAGREVLKTLGSIGSVADALSGLSAKNVVTGQKGTAFRVKGGSGVPNNRGVALVGAGQLKTGASGRGLGKGRSKSRGGAVGSKDLGAGKPGAERTLSRDTPPVAGQGLTPGQISRVVKRRTKAFQACYETALARSPSLSGGVTIEFTVMPGGKVQTAKVSTSSLHNKRVEGCVLRMFRRLRFPRADQATSVSWPFVFKGKG